MEKSFLFVRVAVEERSSVFFAACNFARLRGVKKPEPEDAEW